MARFSYRWTDTADFIWEDTADFIWFDWIARMPGQGSVSVRALTGRPTAIKPTGALSRRATGGSIDQKTTSEK